MAIAPMRNDGASAGETAEPFTKVRNTGEQVPDKIRRVHLRPKFKLSVETSSEAN